MDDLLRIADANGGYLLRHQLNDLGYRDSAIRQATRAGVLRRVRHGTYVFAAVWDLLSAPERLATLTRSVLDKLGPAVVATHQSASALHGHDLWGADLTTVHVSVLDGRRGRTEAGVVYHEGSIDVEDDIVQVDDRQVIEPRRAVFESCSLLGIESGMVLATSAMRDLGISREELEADGRRFEHWPGTRNARMSIRLADPRLESVGEVRSLFMMWSNGVPRPELQWEIVTSGGVLVARVDFAWIDDHHTGEFDGLVKYGSTPTPRTWAGYSSTRSGARTRSAPSPWA
ncbi:hypothetical protein IFT73_12555 [Aeromicrobium sp. CFBP 8757]|uniref:type IV toxin-antitoxin system AbiEi family antitoxin domain-containing protein n=1 Tax=Aeromicrobium sp. CFBP 8757 TaxID=2775288 RepID=UPI00177DE8FB|nr:type IV toxin-antitoxin system AbiEi family antitoxin domain-containing protein [Aeromicrobium sp. CFBP 8757]MBD8607688.1 hypothetical protein [Aeromicrobium sp. CFBP 8757]